MGANECTHCANEIPLHMERCPHCALPGLFPNVRAAEGAVERSALDERYDLALKRATARSCHQVVKDFETATLKSYAVIARSVLEADRLASSDKEVYSTYYKLVDAEVRLPSGSKWDVLRDVADGALFPGYKKHIRFGALSLNGLGLANYGECFLVLRESMISHRATVFEENSVLFMDKHDIQMSEAHRLPPGFRALWVERSKLCVAKLADELAQDTKRGTFQEILLKEGRMSANDSFVEAHIWGPMTARSFERVIVSQPKKKSSRVILRGLCEKLEKLNVKVSTKAEVVSCTP